MSVGRGHFAAAQRIPVAQIPTGRARKRRTIPTGQLELALEGRLDAVYGYSFFLTNLPLPDAAADGPSPGGAR